MKIYNLEIKDDIEVFTKKMFYTIFKKDSEMNKDLKKLKVLFFELIESLNQKKEEEIWNLFVKEIPIIKEKLYKDALSIVENDPAADSVEEVIMAYLGFQAIVIYRISNVFYKVKLKIIPRMMSEYAHSITGCDIHPGATIGESFFIDHATGTVIGETVIIKNNVKLYKGVTLGAFHIDKKMAKQKRHPTIEDNVVIYSNATILGGDTIVSKNTTIGANVWLTSSVSENSFVYHKPNNVIKNN